MPVAVLHLLDRNPACDSCVRDHHVDDGVRRDGALYCPFDAMGVGDVDLNREYLTAVPLDRVDDQVDVVVIVRMPAHDNSRSSAREHRCRCSSDPGSATGDECGLVVESKHAARRVYAITSPPETLTVEPTKKEPALEARSRIVGTISSTLPKRPIGSSFLFTASQSSGSE
jgi:hypothetical protein